MIKAGSFSCFITFMLFVVQVLAKPVTAEFVKNYDGDTITVNLVDLRELDGISRYSLFWENISIRVRGIDTPEVKGACSREKHLAKLAKKFVHDKMSKAKTVTLDNLGRDKYFRILADVFVDEQSLATMLLNEGLAVPYDGGTKLTTWCNAN